MKCSNNDGSVFYNKARNRWNAQYKIKEDGKIKVLKRLAFGFRNFTNFKARILLMN